MKTSNLSHLVHCIATNAAATHIFRKNYDDYSSSSSSFSSELFPDRMDSQDVQQTLLFTLMKCSRLLPHLEFAVSNLVLKLFDEACDAHIPIVQLIRGINICRTLSDTTLDQMEIDSKSFVALSDTNAMKVHINCVWDNTAPVSTILLSQNQKSRLYQLILNLFLDIMQYRIKENIIDIYSSPFVIFHCQCGRMVENSKTYFGTLVMDTYIPKLQPRQLKQSTTSFGYVVALFECSLELLGVSTMACTVNLTSTGNTVSLKEAEYANMQSFANMLNRSGVNIVCCQKRVHPHLIALLGELNIQCVPRLSVRYMGAMQRLTGGTQLGSISSHLASLSSALIDPGHLGYLQHIEVQQIFGRDYVVACAGHDESSVECLHNCDLQLCNRVREISLRDAQSTLDDSMVDNTGKFARNVLQRRQLISSVVMSGPSASLCSDYQRAFKNSLDSLFTVINSPVLFSSMASQSDCLQNDNFWLNSLQQQLAVQQIQEPQINCSQIPDQLLRTGRGGGVEAAVLMMGKVLDECLPRSSLRPLLCADVRKCVHIAADIVSCALDVDQIL